MPTLTQIEEQLKKEQVDIEKLMVEKNKIEKAEKFKKYLEELAKIDDNVYYIKRAAKVIISYREYTTMTKIKNKIKKILEEIQNNVNNYLTSE